jgi:hypothetical protein
MGMKRIVETDLITPQEMIPSPRLHFIPDVDELDDSMLPDVVSMVLGFVPCQRCSQRKKAHGKQFSFDLKSSDRFGN